MPPPLRKLSFDEISSSRASGSAGARMPVTVLLDDVRSLYNVGSIFRTCDAARVERLVLTGFTPHPPRKEIEKTALGATATVPWTNVADPLAAIAEMRGRGVCIAAVELATPSREYDSLTAADFPLCLMFGSEVRGLREELVAAADFALSIPMLGAKHSLNVAVAVGIALYAAVRAHR